MKYWLGVVSEQHVKIGVEGGFCQFNHGKFAPLDRMNPGDRLVYYSPKQTISGGEAIQSFTAIGEILTGNIYQVNYKDFKPFRRDVRYFQASNASILRIFANVNTDFYVA